MIDKTCPSTELMPRRFLFLLTGSRRDGNSEALARRASDPYPGIRSSGG